MTEESLRAFREAYRRDHVPPNYRGWLPLTFLYANLAAPCCSRHC
jgi:hypothetical protein